MRHDDYIEHVTDFTAEMSEVTAKKNPDYSMNTDAMNNFKAIATMLGGGVITPTIVWAVLCGKHITAIMSHMAQGKTLRDETIHGRFIDLANYAMLGDALVKDLTHAYNGSEDAERSVYGRPGNVRREDSKPEPDRESNLRSHSVANPRYITPRPEDARDFELRGDGERTVLGGDRNA